MFAILGVYMLKGWRKGGVCLLFSLIESAICFGSAFLFDKTVANALQALGFDSFCEKVTGKLVNRFYISNLNLLSKEQIVSKLTNIVAFLLVYIVSKLILWIVKKIFNAKGNKFVGVGNSILGSLVGAVKGYLVFFVLFNTANVVAMLSESELLMNFVQNAEISKDLISVFEEKIISVFLFH